MQNRSYEQFEDCCHELKSSMTVIRIEAEYALLHPSDSSHQCCSALKTVIDECSTMHRLIEQIHGLSREQQQLHFQPETINLSRLLGDVKERCEKLALFRRVQLDAPGLLPFFVSGDYERLHQLFFILIDNAIKYIDDGGRVTIAIEPENDWLKTTIMDTGIGIPESDLARVFDRYYRGKRAKALCSSGAGLGLTMAQSIIEYHQGKIVINSRSNNGTSIIVYLKLK